jgi:hypothetical protein
LNKTKTRRELNILFISILSINTYLLFIRKFKSKKNYKNLSCREK